MANATVDCDFVDSGNGLRANLLKTIGQCRLGARVSISPVESLGWPQIVSTATTATGVLAGTILVVILLNYSPRLSRALAPFAVDRAPGVWPWISGAFVEDPKRPMSIDGVVIVRFCILGRNFCLLGSLVACFLLPCYWIWHSGVAPEGDFLRFTIASMSLGDSHGMQKYWVIIVAMYLLVFACCWLLDREWREFIALRRDHFVDVAACPAHMRSGRWAARPPCDHEAQSAHTVMVEQVPKRIETEEDLRAAFELIFPGGVVCCRMVQVPNEVPVPCACLRSCLTRVLRLVNTVKTLRPSTGFVTLDSMSKRTIALQSEALFASRHTKDSYNDWVFLPAPQVSDLIWGNMHNSFESIRRRADVFQLLCAVGLVLWSSPMFAVMTVTNPTFLHETFPEAMETIHDDAPFLYGLFTASLPMLAVWCIQLLLPSVFWYAATTFEGRKMRSDVARTVLLRSFAFEAALYYFLALGGTAVLSVWTAYFTTSVNSPICTLNSLGRALPQVAVYYVAQVINETMLLPVIQLQVGALWDAVRGHADKVIQCDYTKQSLRLALILNFVNMFAIVCPVILPLGAVYFALAACFFRWSLQNTYGRIVPGTHLREGSYDMQGGLWYELFHCVMVGLLLGVLAVSGVILSQVALALAEDVSLLVFLCCIFMLLVLLGLLLKIVHFWWKCCRIYRRWSEVMPFEDASCIDQDPNHEALVAAFEASYYQDPLRSRAG